MCPAQVDAKRPLQQWQVDAFRAIASDFYDRVHKHHDHEEHLFFPFFETRVKLPPKMSADHKTLMAALDRVRELCCEQLAPGAKADSTKVRGEAGHYSYRTFVTFTCPLHPC